MKSWVFFTKMMLLLSLNIICANLAIAQPSCGAVGQNQFMACYFDNKDFTALKTVRVDPRIDFNWALSPANGVSEDTFSVIFRGDFQFESGEFEFSLTSDDGSQLFVDGVKIVDQWRAQVPTTLKAKRTLTAGRHRIEVRFYDESQGAVVKLDWKQVIPSVSSYTLINSDTDRDIREIRSGDVIDLSKDGTNFNIRANFSGMVGSVKMQFDSEVSRIENGSPYAVFSNSGSDYSGRSLPVGTHTIISTPYAGANASGLSGVPDTLTIKVVQRVEKAIKIEKVKLDAINYEPGTPVKITYSFSGGPSLKSLKTFVHFLDTKGVNAFQDDHFMNLSTDLMSGGLVSYQRTVVIPSSASGSYRIAAGLYDPATGERANLLLGEGVEVLDNRRWLVGAFSVNSVDQPPSGDATQLSAYNPCGNQTCEIMQPLVIKESGKVIRNIKISNPAGDCIVVMAPNVVIENSEIGPCQKGGIVTWTSGTQVSGNYIHNTGKEAVYTYNTTGLTVRRNRIETVATGVRSVKAFKTVVDHNFVKNVLGRSTGFSDGTGNVVQFDTVKGGGNRITCNVGINELGKSNPEDLISTFGSQGLPDDYIIVQGNKLNGGGPSASGGGILLGDGSGAYAIAKDNILVNPGQYGMGITGGHHQSITNNIIFARQQSFTNVGIQIWDFWNLGDCHSNSVTFNQINFTNSKGWMNDFWNAGNCGPVSGIGPNLPSGTNVWKAPIDEAVINRRIPACE